MRFDAGNTTFTPDVMRAPAAFNNAHFRTVYGFKPYKMGGTVLLHFC